MPFHPADRIAIRRSAKLDPSQERARIAGLLATLPPTQHVIAAQLAAEWPRLIHKLARRGELASPSFDRVR